MTDQRDIRVRLAVPDIAGVRACLGDAGVILTEAPLAHESGRRVLVAFRPPADEPIDRYDWIHIAGAGADHILKALPEDAPVPILTRTVGKMGRQIAEHVLSYILADLERHARREELQRQRSWNIPEAEGRWLFETDVAILGTGGVAKGIAEVLRPLARSVTGYATRGRREEPFTEVRALSDFRPADVIVNALPATPRTENLVGERIFREARGSLFINIGRGMTLDDDALVAALDAGRLRRAVLDVFRQEPLPAAHRFWGHPKITVTPHVSGITRPEDTAEAFLAHLPAFRVGTLQSTVDPGRGY